MEPIVNRMTAIGQYAEDDDTGSSLTAVGYKEAKDLVIERTWWDGSDTAGSLTVNSDNQRMPDKSNFQAIIEPVVFVKAKRAQSDQDDETWKADAPHPTLNQFDQGDSRTVTAVVVPGTVRRLTPTECERLQGFPDGWTEGQADSHRYKQMGNAVAVPVVEWIMQGIVEVMNDEQ
jgi:site-specific DNA-cytosine methylase